MILKALIVDDEARARRTLAALIREFCGDIEIVESVGSVDDALEVIRRSSIDVVFLDVSMPEKDGFALAELPELSDLSIVFITAHANFALNAFRVDAVDYLLKPVNVKHLRTAIERVRRLRGDGKASEIPSLRFYSSGEHHLVPLNEIEYLEADGAYTYIQSTNKRYMVSRGMKRFEERLPTKSFYRTHRSFLVNLDFVARLSTQAAAVVVLKSGKEVPVSRYRRTELLGLLRGSLVK